MEIPPLSPGSLHLPQARLSLGLDWQWEWKGRRALGTGLTGGRASRWAVCWLGTRSAEALDAWWALRPAGGPAAVASAVAEVAEREAELVSLSGHPKSLSECWHGGAGLGEARETVICPKNIPSGGWPD